MNLQTEETSYYEVLDIGPDASPKDVQDAYLRAKSAYNKDSVALYTLIGGEEREETLRKIEEAYIVLSNPLRRKEYDECHGRLGLLSSTPSHEDTEPSNVISIDRVPPMESGSLENDLLVPPTTDFAVPPPPPQACTPAPNIVATPIPAPAKPASPQLDPSLEEELAQEVEWRGTLLRRVREAQRISIEEMSSGTRISKTYLQAIEGELHSKLPAPVYLRGFLTQIAKILKLPHDKVAAAYLARYYQARPDQRPG